MGYRAHVVTQEREYGSHAFSNWDNFSNEFVPKLIESGLEVNYDETETNFDIPKDQLKKYAENLTRKMLQGEPANTPSDYPGMSIGELEVVLVRSIRESPGEWVTWEWY